MMHNKIREILDSFIKERNIKSLVTPQALPVIAEFNEKNFNLIKFYNNSDYTDWLEYYILHSIDFKVFMRYAKEKGIYEKFIHNYNMQGKQMRTLNFIDTSFLWLKTKEGDAYWFRQSEDFRVFLKKLKNAHGK